MNIKKDNNLPHFSLSNIDTTIKPVIKIKAKKNETDKIRQITGWYYERQDLRREM